MNEPHASAPRARATAWMQARSGIWKQWLAEAQIKPRTLTVTEAQRQIEHYRALARDLVTARRVLPDSRTTQALQALYAAWHARIDRHSERLLDRAVSLYREEIPQAIAALRPMIGLMALLMMLCAGAAWWLVSANPELISLIASSTMIDKVQHGQLWTDGLLSITPPSLLSTKILSNNILVAVASFCGGLFFGLGAFWMAALNGLMLGGVFAFTHQYGLDGELLKFVIAHGLVELSVLCIAGAGGIALADSLIRPAGPSRRDSLQAAAAPVGRVLLACALLLIICGLIEGFISPDPRVPLSVRVPLGVGYWALMWAFLSGRLWGQRPAGKLAGHPVAPAAPLP